jgi:hypothetical protein
VKFILSVASLLAAVIAAPHAIDKRSILGDITKDVFPTLKVSLDKAFVDSVDAVASAVESDIKDYISKNIQWIPKQPFDVGKVIHANLHCKM